MLTDLCKDFDCIMYDFLLTKIEAYAFFYEALKVINNSFSNFIDLPIGAPQSPNLDPLLFNIYICDLLCFIQDENVT